MKALLPLAALLTVGIGVAHSWLGERYIMARLMRRDLPRLFGSDRFTKRTLRFAWHLTTVAWWGYAAVLVLASDLLPTVDFERAVLLAVSMTFLAHAAVTLAASRGRHFAWIVFLLIALLSALAAR